jgi:predicted ribosome quality control (RQC) complex YloA/Tae2 family protein
MTTIEAHAGEDIETFVGRMCELSNKGRIFVTGFFNEVKLETGPGFPKTELINKYYRDIFAKEKMSAYKQEIADTLKRRVIVLRKIADELEEMLKEMGEK